MRPNIDSAAAGPAAAALYCGMSHCSS